MKQQENFSWNKSVKAIESFEIMNINIVLYLEIKRTSTNVLDIKNER